MRTPLARRVLTALAGSAVLVLPAGCGGQVISAADATVLVAERTGSGMDALGGGRLEVVGGCLGASGYVIVWPHGTEVVSEDPLTIEIPDNGTFALGDDVQVAGGFVLEHSSRDAAPSPAGSLTVGGITVPARCAQHDVFLARPGD